MRKAIVLCLLLVSFAMSQRQRVVVLPTLADPDAKLSPKQLDLLTEDIRTIVARTLPNTSFNLLKQDEVAKKLGDSVFVNSCKEGNCVGDFVERVEADFGARCDVYTVGGQLYMKFELYGTLKGQSGAGTIDQFNEDVKNFADMQAKIKAKVPTMFEMITKSPQEICDAKGKGWMLVEGVCKSSREIARQKCEAKGEEWKLTSNGDCKSLDQIACEDVAGKKWVEEERECKTDKQICESQGRSWVNGICKDPVFAPPPMPQQAAAGGNYFSAAVVTIPSGATLHLNGAPYQGCPGTPCTVSSYEKKMTLTAILNEYETADTTFTIVQPNQRVNIKLNPKTYNVQFESSPSWALLSLNGETNRLCPKTPCRAEFKKGNVRVKASLDLYDNKDTTVFVSGDNQRVSLNLNRNYGTMNIKTKGEEWSLMIEDKPSYFNDIKLPPGTYKVKLTHECYEDINFNANIRKATDEVFDLEGKAVLKCGALEIKSANLEWTLAIDGKNYRSLNEVALSPGFYKARLTHELYEDIDFDVELKKGESVVFDIADKMVHRYGYLQIMSSDDDWDVNIGGKSYILNDFMPQALDKRVRLLPGAYKVKFSHRTSRCYEDIELDAEIKRGEMAFFDISGKIKPKTASLALYVKYKGRNQKAPVFVDGKEVGNTPFKELVSVCSESAELGEKKERISLSNFLVGNGVEHTRNLPTWKSTLLSLTIGTVGSVLLYNAYSQNSKTSDYMDEYDKLNSGYPLEYDKIRKKANDAHGKMQVFLISGGASIAAAMGVYLWF